MKKLIFCLFFITTSSFIACAQTEQNTPKNEIMNTVNPLDQKMDSVYTQFTTLLGGPLDILLIMEAWATSEQIAFKAAVNKLYLNDQSAESYQNMKSVIQQLFDSTQVSEDISTMKSALALTNGPAKCSTEQKLTLKAASINAILDTLNLNKEYVYYLTDEEVSHIFYFYYQELRNLKDQSFYANVPEVTINLNKIEEKLVIWFEAEVESRKKERANPNKLMDNREEVEILPASYKE